MTFLNPALAFGALAFLIPLVIHILNRSRFKTVDWGAMHLLESVIQSNRKRFRLDQLILLLVRCLIPALLAFCIARPLFTSSKTIESDTPVSMVVLLDASYSMETKEPNGTRWQQAITATRELVDSLPKGSDVSVLLVSDQPFPLFDEPVFDLNAVDLRLESLEGGRGACDIRTALQSGWSTLSQMSNPHRELVLISDFQQADWQQVLEQGLTDSDWNLESMNIKPAITLFPIGKSQTENLSVQAIEYPAKAIGCGETHTYRVIIRNHGPVEATSERISFMVDENESSVSEVTVPALGTRQVLFTHSFEQPGSHLVKAVLGSDDTLPFDNQRSASVTVWNKISVLLVDGAPSPEPLRSETDYLQVALTPFTLGRLQLADLIESRTVLPNQLDASSIDWAQVLVLANVARLSVEQTSQLSRFVENGGVLLIFPGDQIDLAWYRESLFQQGSGLLPFGYGARKKGDPRAARIVTQRFDHPALAHFNEPSHGDLSQAAIRQWYEMNPAESANVLIRLNNTDPFLVEKKWGTGMVYQAAIPCDSDWSDLPIQPAFLPFIQQLITTTTSRMIPDRNLRPGEPAVLYVSDSESGSQLVSVRTPDGFEQSFPIVEQDGRRLVILDRTHQPGVYDIQSGEDSVKFVVSPDPDESMPQLLNADQIKEISDASGAKVVTSSAEYLAQDHLRRNGFEIWKFLLMAFLGLLFLEVVLQQRFARVPA